MAIVAPMSKFSLKGLKIYMGACIIAAAVLAYDGYLSKYEWSKRHGFYKEHVIDNNGEPDGAMKFNRVMPPILFAGAVLFGIRFAMIRNRKIVVDETGVVTPKQAIGYDSIEKIDRTNFDSKGYFVITYKNNRGGESVLKLSSKTYDDLQAILNELIAKIT